MRNPFRPRPSRAELLAANRLLTLQNATMQERAERQRALLRSTEQERREARRQLWALRAELDNTMRRLAAVEADFAEVCGELEEHKTAARMWITRTVTPTVVTN